MIINRVMTLASVIFVTMLCSACGSDEGDINGRQWNPQSECWGASERAGSAVYTGGCNLAITLACDKQGDYWWFSSGCIPNGFRRSGCGGSKPPHDAPRCEDLE